MSALVVGMDAAKSCMHAETVPVFQSETGAYPPLA
jgi:hypothetical protein